MAEVHHDGNMISSTIVWPLLASIAAARVVEPVVRVRQLSEREETSVKPDVKAGQATGSAAAVWNHNVELLTDIQIANKTFKVVLDTGSADMYITFLHFIFHSFLCSSSSSDHG